jgi:hypothetical protein
MNNLRLLKTITLAYAALALTTISAESGIIKANAGTTFTLRPASFDPSGIPTSFTHTVDGVVQVSSLGSCTVHFDVIGIPHPDGSLSLTGTFRITTADGTTTLAAEVEGVVTPDSANPALGNFH